MTRTTTLYALLDVAEQNRLAEIEHEVNNAPHSRAYVRDDVVFLLGVIRTLEEAYERANAAEHW